MSAPGRGRGESKVPPIDEASGSRPQFSGSRTTTAMDTGGSGSSSSTGSQSPSGSGSGSGSNGDKTVRGRGGFKQIELRTIPAGITNVHAPPNSGGQTVQVVANFVKIEPMKASVINQYRVDFEPNIEAVSLRHRLFKQATKDIFQTRVMFDGMSDARSSHMLPNKKAELHVDNPQEPDQKITIKIKHAGVVQWHSFEMIRVYNMHMKQFLRALGYFSVSKTGAYVHERLSNPIGQGTGIMTVRGYRTAANVHERGQMLMNLESVHKLMQHKNVLQNMIEIRNNPRLGPNIMNNVKSQLTGKLVVTNYNKIVYRIEDVNFNLNPASTFFDKRNNRDVTYKEYYHTRYSLDVTDQKQPLLLVIQNNQRRDAAAGGDDHQIYLIPEHCNIAGLTEAQRNDNRLKIELIKASQISPQDRVTHMLTFLKQLNDSEDVRKSLNEWGYSYGQRPMLINARTLNREAIGMGRNATGPPDSWSKVDAAASFDGAMLRESVAKAPDFPKLAIIVGRNDLQNEGQITSKLRTGLQKVGALPKNVEFFRMADGDSSNHYVRQLRNLPPDTTAAIVIMSSQNKEKYDAIKKQASVEKGLITQVVTARLMMDDRKAGGAATKIAIQLAAKLGGEPWYVHLPMTTLMVCGYDTYHDTANRGRSYGAFTASQNPKFSRWYSKADSHDRLEELSSHMTENLGIALKRYKDANGRFPERVMIYRDGVGDGQLEHVFNVEVKQIKKALEACDKSIRLTFIVVNKRIGARFYLKEGNNFSNPPPGTVIDNDVTRQERYDFYLVSQSTRHGTVTPTYYNILHDESGLDASKIQAIAFKMCFMYYNWTGTVRVPAPCQYAHKLALLCGEHLHAIPHANMDNNLHYL